MKFNPTNVYIHIYLTFLDRFDMNQCIMVLNAIKAMHKTYSPT
jgi:hypothetical protein